MTWTSLLAFLRWTFEFWISRYVSDQYWSWFWKHSSCYFLLINRFLIFFFFFWTEGLNTFFLTFNQRYERVIIASHDQGTSASLSIPSQNFLPILSILFYLPYLSLLLFSSFAFPLLLSSSTSTLFPISPFSLRSPTGVPDVNVRVPLRLESPPPPCSGLSRSARQPTTCILTYIC